MLVNGEKLHKLTYSDADIRFLLLYVQGNLYSYQSS